MIQGVRTDVYISRIGRYFPRRRLALSDITAANQWKVGSPARPVAGYRPVCGSDEDAVTMAAAAAKACLSGCSDQGAIKAVFVGCQSSRHGLRQASVVVSDALALDEADSMDIGGARAGTSALLSAIRHVQLTSSDALAICTGHQRPLPGSRLEPLAGDGATSALFGNQSGIARLIGARSSTTDIPIQFRDEDRCVGYVWEDRWIVEEACLKIVAPLISDLLSACGVSPTEVSCVAWHMPYPRAHKLLANRVGFHPECRLIGVPSDSLDFGAATSLHLLAEALNGATDGERVLLIGFGQGCDALLFEARGDPSSDELAPSGLSSGGIAIGYSQYLALAELVETDRGLRAEVDNLVSLSLRHRHATFLTRFEGGCCSACGANQIPRSLVCVRCRSIRSQSPCQFAHRIGTLRTWSADRLATSDDPPVLTGLVDFEGGGRLLMDLADFSEAELTIGTIVRPALRARTKDKLRGFTNYFWKAAPARGDV